jgi:flavorubredoxin
MSDNLKAVKVSEHVWWVGAIDWGLREFHGYSTHRGSTYNAYLVMGGNGPVLIDTVKAPFMDEMYARISSVVEPSKIRTLVSNHAEMDHSGGIPRFLSDIKPDKLYASVNGQKALDAHFRIGSSVTPVKTGDSIDLGGISLSFLETKMLHWPDSMFSYLKEDKLLFSQDGFGMHLATSKLFEDENDWAVVHQEMAKYYANILLPFSAQVGKLLADFPKLGLAVETIATDHGPIWRKNLGRVFELYAKWSAQVPEPKAVVAFDTMWHSTERMAISIADGVREAGAAVQVIPLAGSSRSDVATATLCAGALLVGSPTMNNNMFPQTADVLTYLKGLKPKNLIGAAFGSFGWSGEAVGQVSEMLKSMGVELVDEGIKAKYVPTDDDLSRCFDLGLRTGRALMSKASASK